MAVSNSGQVSSDTNDSNEGYTGVTGGLVWHRTVGAGKAGVPLLVLHGGPGASCDYLEPIEALSDERPVVFYDQLGGGRSDRPTDTSLWTLARFADELAQVRRALGLERVHIVGQSWGSMLAVEYMLTKRPKGVVSLVLSGPCLNVPRFVADQRAWLRKFGPGTEKVITRCEAAGDFGSAEYRAAMQTYYERHVCRLDPWPDCMIRTFDLMGHAVYEHMWGPSEFTVTGTLRDYDRTERLAEIRVPTLFTCGRYDEATPATTAYYQSRLPGSEMVVLEDASHEHHVEKPAEYIRVVRGFLRRADAQGKT